MIDQILGRPSPTLRRSQIFLILFFWVWRLYKGDGAQQTMISPRVSAGPTATSTAGPSVTSERVGGGRAGKVDIRNRIWVLRAFRMIFGGKKMPIGLGWIARMNERISESSSRNREHEANVFTEHFTPYQLVLGTLTLMYALRHLDVLLGSGPPEPLARLVS